MNLKARLKKDGRWVDKEFSKNSSSVFLASQETDEVFNSSGIDKYFPQQPYASQWYCYDLYYNKIAHPYQSLKSFLEECQDCEEVIVTKWNSADQLFMELYFNFHKIPYRFDYKLKNSLARFLNFFIQFLLLIYSIASALIIVCNRKSKVGIWTGDYSDNSGGFDPRLGDLKQKLNQSFVEFVRTNGIREKLILKNLITRKRPVIYYSSLQYFLHLLFTKNNQVSVTDFRQYCLISFASETTTELKLMHFWEYLLEKFKINTFIIWFFSHRTAALLWACKNKKITTIGFMHGLTTPYHMGHEYLKVFRGRPYGPDKFGVWSEYWKTKYQSLSQFYPNDAIEVSGPLRPVQTQVKKIEQHKPKSSRINVLFISEQSIPPEQIYPYFDAILNNSQFHIFLKVRNFGTDTYFKKMKTDRPDLLKHINVLSSSVEEAMDTADVVIGSHSTVVLESSLYLKPFIFLDTEMWGDYYDIKSLSEKILSPYQVIISKPDQLTSTILAAYTVNPQVFLDQVSKIFFGNQSNSGTDWICKQLAP